MPEPTSPPSPDPATPPEGGGGEGTPTVAELAQRVNSMDSKLDTLISSLHGKAADHTEARLDRNSSIADQVQAELAKAREHEAKEKAARDAKADSDDLKARVAALAEKSPAAPVRRVTRLMFGDPT
jgi:hypothetical protein